MLAIGYRSNLLRAGLFAFIATLVVSFQLMGNNPDSVIISKFLKDCKDIYKLNKDSGINQYRQLIKLADSKSYMDDSVATAKITLANYEYYRGNTATAIQFSLDVLNYYQEKKNLKEVVKMLTLTGDILRGNNFYDQSYIYLNEAKTIADSLSDSLLIASVYNRLAAVYFEDVRVPFDTTEQYALVSLNIATQNGIEPLVYNNLNILGVLENKRKNYVKSLEYLSRALPLAIKTFPEDEPLVLIHLAQSYSCLNNYKRATELNLKALKLAQKLNIPQYIRLSCLGLEDDYFRMGDYKKAHQYVVLYYQSKEFILSQKVFVQLVEFKNKMAVEKERSENQRLIFEQKLAKGRLQKYMILGILLLVLLVASVVFLIYQKWQRNKIDQIAGKLDQSNRVLKRFISILGHDLRSPFNAILGFTDLLKNDPELSEEERASSVNKLYSVSRSTYKLLDSILEWSRLQSGSVDPVKRNCDLAELVRDTIVVHEPAALLKKIDIVYSNSAPVPIFADPDMILVSVRNILSTI